jgi:alkylation response protein AidB-like acyl-CoA dehydrogenase
MSTARLFALKPGHVLNPAPASGFQCGCSTPSTWASSPVSCISTSEALVNGSRAGVAVVWAKTDEGVRGFLVPAGTAGFRAIDVKDKLSLVASTTSELVLEDCRLGEDSLLPEVSSLRGPLACLNEARYGIVWGAGRRRERAREVRRTNRARARAPRDHRRGVPPVASPRPYAAHQVRRRRARSPAARGLASIRQPHDFPRQPRAKAIAEAPAIKRCWSRP